MPPNKILLIETPEAELLEFDGNQLMTNLASRRDELRQFVVLQQKRIIQEAVNFKFRQAGRWFRQLGAGVAVRAIQ